jgi:hypothetical protein
MSDPNLTGVDPANVLLLPRIMKSVRFRMGGQTDAIP